VVACLDGPASSSPVPSRCYGSKVEVLGGPTHGAAVRIFRKGHPPLDLDGVGGDDISYLIMGQTDEIVPLPTLFGNPKKSQVGRCSERQPPRPLVTRHTHR
jgi:hypothetical protein